jgi:integrase
MLQQALVALDETKLATVTANLEPSYKRRLVEMPVHNANTICDSILDEITTGNIRDSTKGLKIFIPCQFSVFHHHKPFREMTREDILLFINSARKSETDDPKQKWIGNYNSRVRILTKFFKWLYSPKEHNPKQRKMPKVMSGIIQLSRKSESTYRPEDVWSKQEQAIFLKYCPSKRDRAYVATNLDTSARPHEILGKNINELQFELEPSTGIQYSEITVSGKTGTRTLPVIDSIPYLKEWLAVHPMGSNPQAPIFISESDRCYGARLNVDSLWRAITRHKEYFQKLLENPDVPAENKEIINGMLKNPWNPYIFRHTALTEKAQYMTEAMLRSHAGWSKTSKMPAIYLHFFGTESSRAILEAKGVIPKDTETSNSLQSKYCPHCKEPNTPHAKFCHECKMVLTYDGYAETQSKFQDLCNELGKAQMDADFERENMMQQMKELRAEMERIKAERK